MKPSGHSSSRRVAALLAVGGALFLTAFQQAESRGLPWYIWALIILVLIVLIVWAVGRSGRPAESPPTRTDMDREEPLPPAESLTPHFNAPDARYDAMAPPAGAPEMPADDLVVLEGIGPKTAGILGAAGITTFRQLAAADVDQLRAWLVQAGLPMIDPASWPEQARLAADGDQAGLQALQDRLKGGRMV